MVDRPPGRALVVGCLLALSCSAPDPPADRVSARIAHLVAPRAELPEVVATITGPNEPPLGSKWGALHPSYVPAVRRVVGALAALAPRHPSLAGALAHPVVVGESAQFSARWGHTFGAEHPPNPDYDPRRPESPVPPTREVLRRPDGLRVDLAFYEGAWSGLDLFEPVSFGAVHVRVLVDAPDETLRADVRRALLAILEREGRTLAR